MRRNNVCSHRAFSPVTFNDVTIHSCVLSVQRRHDMIGVLSLRPGLRWPSKKKKKKKKKKVKKVPGQVKLLAGLDPFQLASNHDSGCCNQIFSP